MEKDWLNTRAAYIFDDYFDVDYIIGPERMHTKDVHDIAYLRQWLMHDFDENFSASVRPGDCLIGGRAFGFGHPHAFGMRAMRDAGINIVIAESFYPAFLQGETFNGMVLVTCPGIRSCVSRWDAIELNLKAGRLRLPGQDLELSFTPFSEHQLSLIRAGGVMNTILQENDRKSG